MKMALYLCWQVRGGVNAPHRGPVAGLARCPVNPATLRYSPATVVIDVRAAGDRDPAVKPASNAIAMATLLAAILSAEDRRSGMIARA